MVLPTASTSAPKLVALSQTFRRAQIDPPELHHLATIYEKAWGIPLPQEKLKAQIGHFPDGQIVGTIASVPLPISMINIMLTLFDPHSFLGFSALEGYERISGSRTFHTHVSLSEVQKRKFQPNQLALALCMSIVVDPAYQKSNYAVETLNHAIDFAERAGALAVPYSAPRGYGRVRALNPHLSLESYLNMTRPILKSNKPLSYDDHKRNIEALNGQGHRQVIPFRGQIPVIDEDTFALYQQLEHDSPLVDFTYPHAFETFVVFEAPRFEDHFGRAMTMEDMCVLTGRRPYDPTMSLHITNGARYVRDGNGEVVAFADSRPDDLLSFGYNVLLTYTYHPALGQAFL
ncbi:hypothetical protein HY988_02840 [Candidatus Micrarchaeota archaeon]|nr:hypothetical protein [Candidatus Micrarchaeota archaeon]